MNLDELSPRELQNIHGLTLVDILKTTEVLPHTLKELCKSTDMYLRWFLADKYKYMTGAALHLLARDYDDDIRKAVAENPRTGVTTLLQILDNERNPKYWNKKKFNSSILGAIYARQDLPSWVYSFILEIKDMKENYDEKNRR